MWLISLIVCWFPTLKLKWTRYGRPDVWSNTGSFPSSHPIEKLATPGESWDCPLWKLVKYQSKSQPEMAKHSYIKVISANFGYVGSEP